MRKLAACLIMALAAGAAAQPNAPFLLEQLVDGQWVRADTSILAMRNPLPDAAACFTALRALAGRASLPMTDLRCVRR